MASEILLELVSQGVLGGLLVLALVAVARLYFKNQELWKCMLELQQEHISEIRQQFEYIDAFRECMETVVRALQEARGTNSEGVTP